MLESLTRTLKKAKPYVEVIVARILNHPGEQLGITLLASRWVYADEPDLLAEVLLVYTVSNFVYYVDLAFLQKLKGMIHDRLGEDDRVAASSAYIAGNIICAGVSVVSIPVFFTIPLIFKLSKPVRNSLWIYSVNNYVALNNAMDRQALVGSDKTTYSLFSSMPNVALTLGLTAEFIPRYGAVGVVYASLVGLTSTKLLNLLRLGFANEVFHKPDWFHVKQDLIEMIKDGLPNSLTMIIEMSSLTVLPFLLKDEDSLAAYQLIFVLNGFINTISQGINTVSGRDIYAAKKAGRPAAVKRMANRALLATGVVSATTLTAFSIFRQPLTSLFSTETAVQSLTNVTLPLITLAEGASVMKQSMANSLRMGYNDNWIPTGLSLIANVTFIGMGIGLSAMGNLKMDSGIFLGCMLLNFFWVMLRYIQRQNDLDCPSFSRRNR